MTRFRELYIVALILAAAALPLRAQSTAPSPTCDACDANCDGEIDGRDAQAFMATLLGGPQSRCSPCAADLDGANGVTAADIAPLVRCILGEHRAQIQNGCLQIIGTPADSALALRLRAGAPNILDIDVGNDGVPDFAFDRDLFTCIQVFARGGNDLVFIDESNGIFTDTELTTIDGGSGADTLIGGSGGETFIGGPGNDTAVLGPGNDRFIWNPGDGTDTIDGRDGIDTVEVNGDDSPESFAVTANGANVRFDRISPAPFFLDIAACENLVLNAKGGNDSLACTGNLAALIQITADGGPGDDTLLGSNGPDVLLGGDDNDFIDGNQGNDTIHGGAGNDTVQWDPGDGSDIIDGDAGHDTIVFNGSNANETFDLSPNGQRLRFTRNIGAITLDADTVEQFDLRALGGTDIVNANDLTPTALTQLNIDLAATLGGTTGDAAPDTVNIIGSPQADTFNVSADSGFVVVDRSAAVRVRGYETSDQLVFTGIGGDTLNINGSPAADTITVTANGTQARIDATGFSAAVGASGALSLVINGLAGNDTLTCVGNLAAIVPITLDGGPGDDTLLGSNGPDLLLGGDDNDFLDGNQGNDTVHGGPGNDTFQWDPGDGSDTVDGDAGQDVIVFNGSAANETFDFSAAGQRLRFTRNVGAITLDADTFEQFDLRALGGADIATINDLTGTALAQINIDLAGTIGGPTGDAQADNIIVNATSGDDTITVAGGLTGTLVVGLSATVNIAKAEAANDGLTINALAGNDTVQAAGLASGFIALTINGGFGDDTLTGSAAADLINGDEDNDTLIGRGNDDTLQGGSGNDRFIWNPGDGTDTIDGRDGIDTVEVNGDDSPESFTVTANGANVRFDRISPAPFFLDIAACENLVLNAHGGNDSLACTGNLAALIQITADGGPGDDTLLGSNGADVLLGGDDNDFIDGNQGNDTIRGGAGNDTVQWDPGDGSDTVDGDTGHDTIVFNGSNANETFDLSANGPRLRFTRNIGAITLDADTFEQFDLRALGGTDIATVNDLTTTTITQVNIDLAGSVGGTTGDAQPDTITVNGTTQPDAINVAAIANAVEVTGLPAAVRIMHSDPTTDSLTINGNAGADTITPDPNVTTLIMLTINQ